MATPTRILLVSSEVAPYTDRSALSDLVRRLPEQLQEEGDYDVRIMMPRYGTISERKNRLHEVIRLSGTDVRMRGEQTTLKVKVASIPGARLQVYFMDSKTYFKRKGIYAGRDGAAFEDNVERALFFGRSVVNTLEKLRWAPDVLHAFGSMSGLLPMVLRREKADAELFQNTSILYTPDAEPVGAELAAPTLEQLQLELDESLVGGDLVAAGTHYADAFVDVPGGAAGAGALRLELDEALGEQAHKIYAQTNIEVAA